MSRYLRESIWPRVPTLRIASVNRLSLDQELARQFRPLKPGLVQDVGADHYRFTWDSLRYLFRKFSHVEVHHHGNRLQVMWELMNAGARSRVVLNLLNPLIARINVRRTRFPLGFVVYAQR